MHKMINGKRWMTTTLFISSVIATPMIIAANQTANFDAQFRPSQTILDSTDLSSTKAAAAQSMQQMQANIAAQKQKNDVYLQQVMQQISTVGKIPETATSNTPAASPQTAISTPKSVATPKPAVVPSQPAPQPTATATGLPTDTTTTAPASGSAESWPLGF